MNISNIYENQVITHSSEKKKNKKLLILLDELHQANPHFVIRFVSLEGISHTVYLVLDVTYEH